MSLPSFAALQDVSMRGHWAQVSHYIIYTVAVSRVQGLPVHLAPSLCSALPVRRRRILGLCLAEKREENHIGETRVCVSTGKKGKEGKIQRQTLPLCARAGEKIKERVCGGGLWRWSRAEREWEIRLNRSSLTNITNSWGRVGGSGSGK